VHLLQKVHEIDRLPSFSGQLRVDCEDLPDFFFLFPQRNAQLAQVVFPEGWNWVSQALPELSIAWKSPPQSVFLA
jgi:hypothetical protein